MIESGEDDKVAAARYNKWYITYIRISPDVFINGLHFHKYGFNPALEIWVKQSHNSGISAQFESYIFYQYYYNNGSSA